MPARPTLIEPNDEPDDRQTGDQTAEDALYYRGVLHQLIDMGLDLAKNVHQQATTQAPEPDTKPAPDPSFAFDRISRAIRRTIALARTLAEPPRSESAAT